MQPNDLMVGWTTTETRADAESLARGLVEAGLAACAQVSGPISSFYRWEKKIETAQEFRIAVKFAAIRADEVSTWLSAHHPYDTPQWVAVRADDALKNYLKWVVDHPT
jgi:periplasmic divalent cation tolerance protein